MRKIKRLFLSLCLVLVSGLFLPQFAVATDNIIDEFPSRLWFCTSHGELLITYADVDNDDSTGVWVGGTWYPNETQIVLYPVQGDLSVNAPPLDGEIFFSFVGVQCGETGWHTKKGKFVIRFVDATAPGWEWDNPSTWQEQKISEAQLRMGNDGTGNYWEYYGHNDPSNVINPMPYQQAKAYEHWEGVNEVAYFSVDALETETGTLTGETGFSEILFTTEFTQSSVDFLYLFNIVSVNTPAGSPVSVSLGNVSVTFDTVTGPGNTEAAESDTGPPLPVDFQASCSPPLYYDVNTSAVYSGSIEVCIQYDDTTCDETDMRLLHDEGGAWVDRTTSIDTVSNIICATVTSLSDFVLASPAEEPVCDDCWAATYGTFGRRDEPSSIMLARDGGYILAGDSFGDGGSDPRLWMMKLTTIGTIEWQYMYAGIEGAWEGTTHQTRDGGFVRVSTTNASSSGNAKDIWVLRLNQDGSSKWQMTYGHKEGYEYGKCIQQTVGPGPIWKPSGFILAGQTNSFGATGFDIWVLKLNEYGSIAWQNRYGGDDYYIPHSIIQTFEPGFMGGKPTGYILAGGIVSAGDWDMFVLKLDEYGKITWQKTYGGSEYDWANAIQRTSDGGYIVTGLTKSYNDKDYGDLWVLKLYSNGSIGWQKSYGGKWSDIGDSICQTADGGYIVAGSTKSFTGNIFCYDDLWLLKLNSDGNIVWEKTYGECDLEVEASIYPIRNEGYLVAGATHTGAWEGNSLILKLDKNGNIQDCPLIGNSDAKMTYTYSAAKNAHSVSSKTTATEIKTKIPAEAVKGKLLLACGEFQEPCEGDFEPDGDVDDSDLSVFAPDFGQTVCLGDCESDFNNDSDVDGADLAMFAANFGRCP